MPPPSDRRSNVLAPATSFVGREGDLVELEERLASSRLVTVLGPPGAGKTRLAIEHALRRGGDGGTFLCELADAPDVLGFARVVARALGVTLATERGAGDPLSRLGAALAARGPILLVLDNFEHLARVAADAVARWRDAAPELALLVTSRERLGVPGEALLELGPLALPARGDPGAAVRLFVDRARAVRPGYAPSPKDVEAIAELCRRLDGLPLAIELAAARAGVLGPRQLLDRIGESLDLLADRRDRRRSTLRATLDWSWNLLEPTEQAALAQLSVFHDGFSLEAAEAVLLLPASAGGARSAVDVIEALRDRSLVRAGEAPELPGEIRFGLLETIRSYAAEKLEVTGEGDAARERHAEHYARAAEAWAARVERGAALDGGAGAGGSGPEALRRLAVDMPNLLAVHARDAAARTPAAAGGADSTRSAEAARLARALGVVLSLENLLYMRGPTSLCLALVDAVLERAIAAGVAPALAALGLKARGRALKDLGRLDEAARELERGLAIARAAGELAVEGRLLGQLAFLRQTESRLEDARALLEESVARVRAGGDARSEGMALAGLAQVLGLLGRADDAARAYDEALALDRAVGNRYAAAFVLTSRAELSRSRGRPEAARVDLEQGLAIYAEFDEIRHEGIALADLGVLHQEQGRLAEARDALERALDCHRDYGSRWLEGAALGQLGDLAREEGDLAAARRLYAGALAAAREVGDRHGEARWLLGAASAGGGAAALDEGEALLAEIQSPIAGALVALHRGLDAASRGDLAGARARLERVDQSLAAAGSTAIAQPAPVRFAHRILARAAGGAATAVGAGTVAPSGVLEIAASGRWFRLAGGERVSLSRRHALRLLVQRFAEHRLGSPGQALTPAMLLEAGWPGEKVRADAGTLRVYNAMSTLRRLGLREVLLSRDDGYLLDPAVETVRVDDP